MTRMTRRHSDVSNEEGSRTVGVEEGLNALTSEKRDVKLQGDPLDCSKYPFRVPSQKWWMNACIENSALNWVAEKSNSPTLEGCYFLRIFWKCGRQFSRQPRDERVEGFIKCWNQFSSAKRYDIHSELGKTWFVRASSLVIDQLILVYWLL